MDNMLLTALAGQRFLKNALQNINKLQTNYKRVLVVSKDTTGGTKGHQSTCPFMHPPGGQIKFVPGGSGHDIGFCEFALRVERLILRHLALHFEI